MDCPSRWYPMAGCGPRATRWCAMSWSPRALSADDWIAENVKPNDIVITADIPLASRTVAAGAHVLGPTGRPFTQETIGMAVAMRDLKQRRGPAKARATMPSSQGRIAHAFSARSIRRCGAR